METNYKSKILENFLKMNDTPKPEEKLVLTFTMEQLKLLIKETIQNEMQNYFPMQNSAEPDLFNIKQASKYLNLAVTTIYEKTSLGLIPFYKRDKKLYFKKEELQEWLLKRNEKEVKTEAIIRKLPLPKSLKVAA